MATDRIAAQAVLDGMTDDEVIEQLNRLLDAQRLREYDPYPYQLEFHGAGEHYPERLLRAGNRIGKTHSACAEDVFHLLGEYPEWWEGKRFKAPTKGWAVSVTNETSRDVIQACLLGDGEMGTGLIPKDRIVDWTTRNCGLANVVETVFVRHANGGVSTLSFKCYEQGWKKFTGAAVDFIHFDEEPDDFKVYTESRMRIITRGGTMYATITPLQGETELIRRFMEHKEGTFQLTASMLECPHLNREEIEAFLADFPEHEREARLNGTPIMGEGRVFAYGDREVICGPFEIPTHFARIAGIDFGINEDHQQATSWLAWDRDNDILYVYGEYKEPDCHAGKHALVINERGRWIPISWPHDGNNRERSSGVELQKVYKKHGVNMLSMSARYNNETGGKQAVEPIVTECVERLETGRLKIFSTCRKTMDEFRSLHRKNGLIVAARDDLMKAMFYGIMMRRFALPEHMPSPIAHQRAEPEMTAWANV